MVLNVIYSGCQNRSFEYKPEYKTVVKIYPHALLIKCSISSLLICSVSVVSSGWDSVLREASKQLAPTKQSGKFTIHIQLLHRPVRSRRERKTFSV